MESQSNDYLDILHFNDVYVLTETEGEAGVPTTGGAARFVTAMKQHGSERKLVLFSGDLLAPSLLSEFFYGMQFVEVFNALNVQVSCLGNHDVFDYGVNNFKEFDCRSRALVDETTDKTKRKYNHWLMANCFLEKKAIANLAGTHIID
jgi:2',3'-cyclic-nucleotide 2'-phosphodiesterase (5'-nucleotidase family)